MSCQFIIMITKKSAKDEAWLVHVANAPKQSASADGDVITWAGYNSLLANDVSVKPPAVTGVYPLFPDKAASASSMKHAMELPIRARPVSSVQTSHCMRSSSLSNGNFPPHWDKTSGVS